MKSKTGSAQVFKLQALTLIQTDFLHCETGVSNFLLTFHCDYDYAHDYHWHYHYLWHQHRDFHFGHSQVEEKRLKQVANYAK